MPYGIVPCTTAKRLCVQMPSSECCDHPVALRLGIDDDLPAWFHSHSQTDAHAHGKETTIFPYPQGRLGLKEIWGSMPEVIFETNKKLPLPGPGNG